jgi:VIT1/CCC1 family predicted Fe2+/Mn2+ transporter
LREAVFGINDGLVATVGLVSGEVLSGQPRSSVLIAALSAVGAATVSMGIGSYLASSSQNDFARRQVHEQKLRIRRDPAHERAAVNDILEEMGVVESVRRAVMVRITDDRRRWLRFLVRERLGLHESRTEHPVKNAFTMAGGVILGTVPPVLPFLLPLSELSARNAAWILSLLAAFGLGAVKGRLTHTGLWLSGLQFMLLAGASSAVGAGIGILLGHKVA